MQKIVLSFIFVLLSSAANINAMKTENEKNKPRQTSIVDNGNSAHQPRYSVDLKKLPEPAELKPFDLGPAVFVSTTWNSSSSDSESEEDYNSLEDTSEFDESPHKPTFSVDLKKLPELAKLKTFDLGPAVWKSSYGDPISSDNADSLSD